MTTVDLARVFRDSVRRTQRSCDFVVGWFRMYRFMSPMLNAFVGTRCIYINIYI